MAVKLAYDIQVVHLAGSETVTGAKTFSANVASTTTATGTIIVTGGVGVSGAINSGSPLTSGVAKVGTSGQYAGWARFGHSSFDLGGGYGFMQNSNGGINVDAATGNTIQLLNNNSTSAIVAAPNIVATSTSTGTLQVVGGIGLTSGFYGGAASTLALGTTSSTTPLTITSSINNFSEINLKNTSAGTVASSDFVITADTGTTTTNFVDVGINSSGNTSGVWGSALDGYLYASDNNLWVGTSASGKNLVISAGNGGASACMTVSSSAVTANIQLSNSSGRTKNVQVKTANYTLVSTDHIIVANNSSSFTLTLPAASSNTNREFMIKNKGSATITVDATSSGLIDGQNSTTVPQYSALVVISDGTTWNVF